MLSCGRRLPDPPLGTGGQQRARIACWPPSTPPERFIR